MFINKKDEPLASLWNKLSETLEICAQMGEVSSRKDRVRAYKPLKEMSRLLVELRVRYTDSENLTDPVSILFGQIERILLEAFENDPCSFKAQEIYLDLGPRVSYAYNYPAMVLYTMLCDKKTNLYSITTCHNVIANQLSLGASVANIKGLSADQWHGYSIKESDSLNVRNVVRNLPLKNQKLDWFGHSTESKIQALKASGLLDDLEPAATELVLGLVEGWESDTKDLIVTAKILNK